MPENVKALRQRRKSILATQKITKAMKLVAAAKLRKAQERVLNARPYARELTTMLSRLVAAGAGKEHPLLKIREGNSSSVAYVVFSADRGFAGSYNVNIIRKAQQAIQAEVRPVTLVATGRKARDFFTKRGLRPRLEWVGIGEEARWSLAKEMVGQIIDLYLKGEVTEVRLVYTEFINPVTQKPTEIQLLPISAPSADAKGALVEYIYEPSAEGVLDSLVPRYVETMFYQAFLEAKASELGARMTAMGNATDNAKELISKLTLQMNRARQAQITKELSEIVGGAEALK